MNDTHTNDIRKWLTDWSLLIAVLLMAAIFFYVLWWGFFKSKPVLEPDEKQPTVELPAAPVPETNDSAWQDMKEQLKMTPEKQEAQRRANWKANFPYKETYHPTLRFDPLLYDPKDSSTWHGPERRWIQPVIHMHGYLAKFFENENRFSKGFEDMYHILEEYDRHDNPEVVSNIFENLADYHKRAAHPPDEVITEERDTGEFDPFTGRPLTERVPKHFGMGDEPLKTMTWGELANSAYESIGYNLHARKMWPDKEYMPEAEMLALRDRIIAEIDPADIPKNPGFTLSDDHERALEPGDSFLIPKEGWVEAHWKWQEEAAPIIAKRLHERMEATGSFRRPPANPAPPPSAP
ncbi:MAG: hypothetical protein M2R46_01171 [Verrucomicrobia subdivision 3 bacterium]|nr:hypothetical protein [Limisphaerales bacterium]